MFIASGVSVLLLTGCWGDNPETSTPESSRNSTMPVSTAEATTPAPPINTEEVEDKSEPIVLPTDLANTIVAVDKETTTETPSSAPTQSKTS